MCLSKLFKKKEKTVDYSGIMLSIKNVNKNTHVKHISENIASKDKYFHEFQVLSNPKIKVFVDCKFVGVNPVALEDLIKDDYSKIIFKPNVKVGDGSTELKDLRKKEVNSDVYMMSLDKFLKLADKWNIEIDRDEEDPTMKYIVHAENKTRSINMYLVFDNTAIYPEIVNYMQDLMKTSFEKYKEKVSK